VDCAGVVFWAEPMPVQARAKNKKLITRCIEFIDSTKINGRGILNQSNSKP
jgi:hypothetical protein